LHFQIVNRIAQIKEDFTFQAGHQIELDMGFEVLQSAVFHALIACCNSTTMKQCNRTQKNIHF